MLLTYAIVTITILGMLTLSMSVALSLGFLDSRLKSKKAISGTMLLFLGLGTLTAVAALVGDQAVVSSARYAQTVCFSFSAYLLGRLSEKNL